MIEVAFHKVMLFDGHNVEMEMQLLASSVCEGVNFPLLPTVSANLKAFQAFVATLTLSWGRNRSKNTFLAYLRSLYRNSFQNKLK